MDFFRAFLELPERLPSIPEFPLHVRVCRPPLSDRAPLPWQQLLLKSCRNVSRRADHESRRSIARHLLLRSRQSFLQPAKETISTSPTEGNLCDRRNESHASSVGVHLSPCRCLPAADDPRPATESAAFSRLPGSHRRLATTSFSPRQKSASRGRQRNATRVQPPRLSPLNAKTLLLR